MKTIFFTRTVSCGMAAMLALVGMTSIASISRAETLSCTLDGYAAMGAMVVNTSNPYLLGGNPNEAPQGGMTTWGYGWLKFDGSQLSEPVTSAVLRLQSIMQASGSMYSVPEDIAGGIGVSVCAVTADVATVTSSTADSFRASIASVADTTTVSGGDGFYEWDVTELVNSWIAHSEDAESFGMVLVSSGAIPKFHSSETTLGAAPVINITTAVAPEPSTMILALTAFGLFACGSILRRSRRGQCEST